MNKSKKKKEKHKRKSVWLPTHWALALSFISLHWWKMA